MLNGLKSISKYTGFSIKTVRELSKREDFPTKYIAGRVCCSESAIEIWLSEQPKNHPSQK
jgi:predicted DNA-binding transcriptional regulator AlpA